MRISAKNPAAATIPETTTADPIFWTIAGPPEPGRRISDTLHGSVHDEDGVFEADIDRHQARHHGQDAV